MSEESDSILRTAASGDADQLRDSLKDKALSSLFFFCKVILGYDKMVAHFHLPFCDRVQNSEAQRKRGFLLQRGCFKSTIVGKSYPLWRVIRVAYSLEEGHWIFHPERLGDFRVLVVGESSSIAEKDLRDPRWHIENNQLLRWLFPEIVPPDFNKTTWTQSEILLPRAKSYDESTISATGVGTRITGKHFDMIVYDDIIGLEASESEAAMNDSIEWFSYAPGLLNDPANGEEVLIGTRWKHGIADLYGRIMAELPEETLASGRSSGFTWYIRSATENGEPSFPERFPAEALAEIRKRLSDYRYFCQYENNPIAPGATDFLPSDLREYTISEDNKTLIPTDDSPRIPLGRLHRIQVYDPATRSKTSKCLPAVVATGEDSLQRLFVLDTWAEKGSMGDGVEAMHRFNDNFHFFKSYYELAGQQQAVEDIEQERLSLDKCRRCGKIHKYMRLESETARSSNMSKEERIRNYLQYRVQEHRLYLKRGQTHLLKQLVEFPNGEAVDLLDALAYCSHLSRSPLSDEAIEDIKRDEAEAKDLPIVQRIDTEYNYGGYI